MQAIQFPCEDLMVELSPLAMTVAQMPACGIITIGRPGEQYVGVPAKFLKEFLDAFRRVEQYALLYRSRVGIVFEGRRNRAEIKESMADIKQGIVRLDLVPVSEYRVLLPPTKQEIAMARWVSGVVEKMPTIREYRHTLLVRKGWMAANNGYQLRVARAPETQRWTDGVYAIQVKSENIYLDPADDVEWSDTTQQVIDGALAGHQFRLTVEAVRAAMWRQDHVQIAVKDGPTFTTACKPVLDAIKPLKPADIVVFRANRPREDDTFTYAFGVADRLQVMMSFPDNKVSLTNASPVYFLGSDQTVTITGTSQADVQKATIISPIYMPSSPLLVPDLRAA